jgi:hypothetical protein
MTIWNWIAVASPWLTFLLLVLGTAKMDFDQTDDEADRFLIRAGRMTAENLRLG